MSWKDLLPWNRWGTKRPEATENEPRPVLALQRDMNRVFEDFHRRFLPSTPFDSEWFNAGWEDWNVGFPTVDIEESKKRVEVTVEVPGLSEKDIQLSLSPAGDVLHLRGERRHESTSDDKGEGWRRSERYYGVIQRSIPLPCAVELKDADAKLKKGELRIKLKKREKTPDEHRIRVTAG